MSNENWLSVDEVAQKIGVNAETVREYARTGKLKGYKNPVSGAWRFQDADVTAFIAGEPTTTTTTEITSKISPQAPSPIVDPEIIEAKNRKDKAIANNEALEAEMNYQARQQGYADWNAKISAFIEKEKKFEEEKAKYPDFETERIASGNIKAAAIKLKIDTDDWVRATKKAGEKYLADKMAEGDKYYADKVKEASSVMKDKTIYYTKLLHNFDVSSGFWLDGEGRKFINEGNNTISALVTYLNYLAPFKDATDKKSVTYRLIQYIKSEIMSMSIITTKLVPKYDTVIRDEFGNDIFQLVPAIWRTYFDVLENGATDERKNARGDVIEKISIADIEQTLNKLNPSENHIYIRTEAPPESNGKNEDSGTWNQSGKSLS